MASLTEQQLRELKKAFTRLDSDKNGYLDATELKEFCRICLQQKLDNVTEDMVNELAKRSLKLCDTSGDGLISFDEFVNSYKKSFVIEDFTR